MAPSSSKPISGLAFALYTRTIKVFSFAIYFFIRIVASLSFQWLSGLVRMQEMPCQDGFLIRLISRIDHCR
jgi:hypothetical protein